MPVDHDVERQLSDYGRWLEDTLGTSLRSPSQVDIIDRPRHSRGLRWVLTCAAAALVAALAVASPRNASESVRPAPLGSSSTEGTDVAVAPTTLPVGAVASLTWQVVVPEGTMSNSGVAGLVAGPNGFVATGQGLESNPLRNIGRVWHSLDGVHWEEPALAQFDALAVTPPVATDNAYYLTAGPNTDRSDAPNVPWQLYRSADGVTWSAISELDSSLLAAGNLLLTRKDGHVAVSSDGLTWSTASGLPGAASPMRLLFIGGGYFLQGDGPDGAFDTWSSTDGLMWQPVPRPPEGQLFDLGGTPAVARNPDYESCRQQLFVDQSMSQSAIDGRWKCQGTVRVNRFEPATSSWVPVASSGLTEASEFSAIAVGNRTILALLRANHTYQVSVSDDDALTFTTPDFSADFELTLPTFIPAAATSSTVVFATTDGLGGVTHLIVGS